MPGLLLPYIILLYTAVFLGSPSFAQTVDVHQDHTSSNGEGEDASSEDNQHRSDVMSDFTVENGLVVLTKENFIPAVGAQLETSKYESDAVLVLFVIYSPDCPHCAPVMKELELASEQVGRAWDEIASSDEWGLDDHPWPPPRPLLGKLDGTVTDAEFLANFDPVSGYPTLKFGVVMIDQGDGSGDEKAEDEDGGNDVVVDIFEYVGPLDNPTDFAASVLYYWYRFVGARRMALELISSKEADPDDGGAGDVHVEYNVPVFAVTSDSDLVSFVVDHGDDFLRPAPPHLPDHIGEEEREYVLSLLMTPDDEPDLAEPLTLFVQCRLGRDVEIWESEKNLYHLFDDLAEEMSNRRDVAFFAVHPLPGQDCSTEKGWFAGKGDGDDVDGSVAVLRLRKSHASKDGEDKDEMEWRGFNVNGEVGLPLYVDEGPKEDKALNLTLTQFIVCQSTPTLLWFDRAVVAPYAFPIYRKVHAVLFIDLHHAGKHAPKGDVATLQSRAAVKLFRKAAIDHRIRRPMDDVVFIVVPSTEVRVMTTFGIDIWTGLDDAFVAGINEDQLCRVDEAILPTVMLTSRAGPDGETSLRRYYLPANEILLGMESNEGNGVVNRFISDYFDGKLTPAIQSQAEPTNRTNESGVQSITGDSFKSLVMDREDRHTLVHFYSPTCGHCKRFAVVWNELSRLIRALHWDTVVDVMKMDLTKNEVVHEGLNIWDFPSVYYFPANEKDNAVRMAIEGDEELGESNLGGVNSAYDLVEWLVRQGKLDEHELLRLHEVGSLEIETGHAAIHADGEEKTSS